MLTHPGKMNSSVCFTPVCRGPGYQHNNSPETRRTRRLEIRRWLQHAVQCSLWSEIVSSQGNEIMNNVMVSIKPLWVSTPAVHCWSTQSNKTFYLLASADWGWAEQRAAVAVSVIVISRCWPSTSGPVQCFNFDIDIQYSEILTSIMY